MTYAQAGRPQGWSLLSQCMSTNFLEILVCCGWFTTAEVPKLQEALAKSGVTKPPHAASLSIALQNSHFSQFGKMSNPGLRSHKVGATLLCASYVISFYKKESKCKAKGRKQTNKNNLNRE